MFERQPKDPEDPTILQHLKAGPISIVIRGMLFGQLRVELWRDTKGLYPDIICPVC